MEQLLGVAAKTGAEEVTQTSYPQMSASISGTRAEVGGRMTSAEYSIKSGTVLRVYVKINKGYGKLPESACFYIKVRQGAAYRRVEVNTFQSLSAVFSKAVIEGSFDMLSFDEATAEGVKTNDKFKRLYDSINTSRVITKNEVLIAQSSAAEKKEVVMLENPDTGAEVKIVRSRKRRAIDV